MATKPNFLIIVTDDQGYGDAGCYWDIEVDSSATRKEINLCNQSIQ